MFVSNLPFGCGKGWHRLLFAYYNNTIADAPVDRSEIQINNP